MSGTSWEWRDAGSNSGHMQQVAGDAAYTRTHRAYRAYIDHTSTCSACAHQDGRCPAADQLWESYLGATSS
ncbi:hypothetical protein [Streptomyces sp. NPDC005485]|uniref:hypothetical protein n=1 Tax=Streptomyces sp. NPDC005485 TaxID=3155591 RepID=UPI0033B97FAF